MTEKSTTVVEKPATEIDDTGDAKIDQTTLDEIDFGVDIAVKENQAEKPAEEKTPPGEEKPPEKKDEEENLPPTEKPDGEEVTTETPGDEEPEEITDEHLERAVKVGMTIADARSFQDAKALDNVISMLTKKEGGENETGEEGSDEDPLAAVPDLDPEVFDETLVAVVDALKGIVKDQHSTIKDLRKETVSTRTGSWFDSQVSGQGKEITEALKAQPERRGELKDKFDVLAKGYEAAGKEISQDVVFKEALAVVLGDVVSKAAVTVKSSKLKKRGSQHVARPSGATSAPTADAFASVADELDKEYFDKK